MLEVTKKNHLICRECGEADRSSFAFVVKEKTDDRLSKDNFKFYEVMFVYGGGDRFSYPKIDLKVGDVVATEAVGIDIVYNGENLKVFDAEHIVAKIMGVKL